MTEKRWRVVFYHDRRGRRPVREFLEGLAATERAVVLRSIALLAEFGLTMGAPHVRAIKGHRKLWELRVRTQIGAVRVFYFAHTGRRFILLHGFIKKSAKTPQRELEIAVKRMRDVLEREE